MGSFDNIWQGKSSSHYGQLFNIYMLGTTPGNPKEKPNKFLNHMYLSHMFLLEHCLMRLINYNNIRAGHVHVYPDLYNIFNSCSKLILS